MNNVFLSRLGLLLLLQTFALQPSAHAETTFSVGQKVDAGAGYRHVELPMDVLVVDHVEPDPSNSVGGPPVAAFAAIAATPPGSGGVSMAREAHR
jgi:hypothetical protein